MKKLLSLCICMGLFCVSTLSAQSQENNSQTSSLDKIEKEEPTELPQGVADPLTEVLQENIARNCPNKNKPSTKTDVVPVEKPNRVNVSPTEKNASSKEEKKAKSVEKNISKCAKAKAKAKEEESKKKKSASARVKLVSYKAES